MQGGYIKLHRRLLDWEWYDDINVCRLFIHCLLKANHEEKKWQGVVIPKGSFITSYEKLSTETHLSLQKIRTAIDKLKLTGEITHQTTSLYSIISIKNWNEYQQDNRQNNKQITNEQQTNNKQITTNKNIKNEKNDKNIITAKNEVVDIFINEYKTFFESEYKRIFKQKPFLSKSDCMRIAELGKSYQPETITEALNKLKNLYFKDIQYKPSASWLLRDSNFEKLMNGEFDDKTAEQKFDTYTFLKNLEQQEKEIANGNNGLSK